MTTANGNVATASSSSAATKTAAESTAAWVAMFTEGWANPVDADTFSGHFDPWFEEDVRNLHGTVENWAAAGDVVYIELRLEGTIGGRRFTMHTCDRIRLRDGKAAERVAYLDATPLIKAVARSPRSWPKFLKTQLRNLRRPT
jgi:ketosteroid isomerase-like protein